VKHRTRIPAAALAVAALVAAALSVAAPAEAATTTLAPASALTTTSGTVGSGQTGANLVVKDQSGTQDDWNKYVEFKTNYAGYRTYTLPSSVAPANVTSIQVSVNYRGPATAQQTWTWSLYNWTTSSWTSVGTNASAPSWGSWKLLTFTASTGASSFVNSSGTIRVQVKANNSADSADIDYESLLVTSTDPVTDTTAPSTPTGLAVTGTTSSSVSLSWNASSDNVGVTGYEVFRNGVSAAVATPTGTSATVTGLSANTSYTFTVKARDAAGNRSAASSAVTGTTSGSTTIPLPPAAGKFSYQLGGSYTPESGVQVVVRDSQSVPAGSGYYNICYVNLLQTQPDEAGLPDSQQPPMSRGWYRYHYGSDDLVLKDSSGNPVGDAVWNEWLLDVRTSAKRTALLNLQQQFFDSCKTKGFQAIEPDNLDSDTRSNGLMTFTQTKEYLKLVVPYVHSIGLAIVQKNTSAPSPDGYGGIGKNFVNTVSPAQGFDFAVAEACARWEECDAYTSVYGDGYVFEVEYTNDNPNRTRNGVTKTVYQWACSDKGATMSIILRDVEVVPFGTSGYHYEAC
jgi:hypothetical protein